MLQMTRSDFMKSLSSLFVTSLTFLILSLGPRCHADCFVNFPKNCGAEQFTNACSEPCGIANVNMECGQSVEGNPNLDYISHRGAASGFDSRTFVPQPRYCGIVRGCVCTGNNLGLPFACLATGGFLNNYFVQESYVSGIPCGPEHEDQ